MPNNDNISFRSEEFQDILGRVPGWITRNGTTLVFICMAVFLIGSWFFKYPDIIGSRIVVTTENPPANLMARTTGQISNLYVTDNQRVKKGDMLAMIENPGRYDDFIELKKSLLEARNFFIDFNSGSTKSFSTAYNLGEVQVDYSNFLKQYNDYLYFIQLNYYPRKIASLKEQLNLIGQNLSRNERQVNTVQHEFELEVSQFKRDSGLYKKDVMSLSDYEKSRSRQLSKKFEMEGARAAFADMKLQQIGLDQKIIDAEKESSDTQTGYRLKISEAYNNLLSAISAWELKYVLAAPVDGLVSFNKYWSETQNVKEGDIVMTIIPEQQSKIIGKVELPLRGSGKVKIGQKVNVKFDNYPYMEYGMVRGTVSKISMVPTNNVYMVEIGFPEGLVTNYNVSLELNREVQGTAEIITDQLRLIQRFFNPIKSLFKEKMLD